MVQFVPIDLVHASEAARAQDYRWMRVLVRQEALDLARCDCQVDSNLTGLPVTACARSSTNINLLALREDLVPRTDIFRLDESASFILVTDAVAARVLRAGCTGMEFSDPANRHGGKRIDRYRTVDGIAERRIGFRTDAPPGGELLDPIQLM